MFIVYGPCPDFYRRSGNLTTWQSPTPGAGRSRDRSSWASQAGAAYDVPLCQGGENSGATALLPAQPDDGGPLARARILVLPPFELPPRRTAPPRLHLYRREEGSGTGRPADRRRPGGRGLRRQVRDGLQGAALQGRAGSLLVGRQDRGRAQEGEYVIFDVLPPRDNPGPGWQRLPRRPARVLHHPAGHRALDVLLRDEDGPLPDRRSYTVWPGKDRPGDRPRGPKRCSSMGAAWTMPAVEESYREPPQDPGTPIDYFHINSIDIDFDGNFLISAKRTSAAVRGPESGEILWRLAARIATLRWEKAPGPSPSTMPAARATAPLPSSTTAPRLRCTSSPADRGGPRHGPDECYLVREYTHPQKLIATSQGNVQVLPNGNVFVGWGQLAVFLRVHRRRRATLRRRVPWQRPVLPGIPLPERRSGRRPGRGGR